MRLTTAQKNFIQNTINLESKYNQESSLRYDNGKWFMSIELENGYSYGFIVNSRLLKSLTDKDILINKPYTTIHGHTLEHLALNDEYRSIAV